MRRLWSDGGQSGDLYDLMERPRREMTQFDGLGDFAECADEQTLAAINPTVRTKPPLAVFPLAA